MEKNNIVIKILIIITCIAVLGTCGYLVYNNLKKDENTNNAEKTNTDVNKEEIGEIEINDDQVKSDLTKKIAYVTNSRFTFQGLNDEMFTNKFFSMTYYNSNLFKNLKLTDDEKLYLSILMTQLNPNYTEEKRIKSVSDVEKTYSELFGPKQINHYSVDGCPTYSYDSKENVYYENYGCGGNIQPSILLYKDKFTKEGNKAYVYLNVGAQSVDFNSPSDDNETKWVIYKDAVYEENNTNDIYKKNMTIDEANVFEINEENHNEFAKYKYTFIKDENGNYYFEKIQKIN